jgi:hypothetical protein
LFGLGDDFTSTGFSVFISTTGQPRVLSNNAYLVSGSAGQVVANQWNHIAFVRNSTSLTLYINGVSVGTGTSSATFSGTAYIGAENYNTTVYPTAAGYISNLRVVTSAVYTSGFTPPTTPLTAITNTSLLTCQSNRFVDNSSNAFAITRNGDVSVQAFSPFNPTAAWSAATYGGSGYYDGAGDYLRLAYTSALQFTGNFTIEFWAYPLTQASAFAGVFNNYSSWPSSTGVSIFCGHSSAGTTKWAVALFGTFPAIQSSADYIKNAWSHIALVRNGTGSNNITLYINGVSAGTFTSNNTVTGTADYWWVGTTGDAVSTQNFTGYLADFRATGSAVYTGTFTPPTAPLTAISNTQLLLAGTNAGIYDATSKNDLETVGNAQISTTQSKFGGSSIYLDGTGDYLFPYSASINLVAFGTGDFTVEGWFYRSASATYQVLFDFRKDSTSDIAPLVYLVSGVPYYYTASNDRITGSSSVSNNTWFHLALSRSGTSTKLFVDGTQVGSTYTDSNNYVGKSGRPSIGVEGATVGASPFTGYIQDFRVTKGYARYTANFTPPTTAFPLL